MKKMLLLTPAVAFFMTGCGSVLSVSPLATSDNVIQDTNLTGAWQAEKGDDVLIVRPSKEKGYEVLQTSMRDSATTMKFDVQVVQLNDARYLDIVRDTGGFSIPAHSFGKISLEGDNLKISFFDSDWLKEQIVAKRPGGRLLHKDLMVLPDNTESLQQLILKYADEPQAFGDLMEFHRIAN